MPHRSLDGRQPTAPHIHWLRWAVVVAIASAASGVLWVFLHPALVATGTADGVEVAEGARLEMFTDSGIFVIITAVGGLVLSVLFLISRREPVLALGQIAAGLLVTGAYAGAVWFIGTTIDRISNHGVWPFPPEKLAQGAKVVAALRLETHGALAVPSLIWVLASLADAIIGRRRRRM